MLIWYDLNSCASYGKIARLQVEHDRLPRESDTQYPANIHEFQLSQVCQTLANNLSIL